MQEVFLIVWGNTSSSRYVLISLNTTNLSSEISADCVMEMFGGEFLACNVVITSIANEIQINRGSCRRNSNDDVT